MVQYHVLATLRDMPACSPQRLAKAAGMHPSTLTQSIKRLQKKGALFSGSDPGDSRKKILSMTKQGSRLLENFMKGMGAPSSLPDEFLR
jgi:DNA-binding MarR family transcriptional regulator